MEKKVKSDGLKVKSGVRGAWRPSGSGKEVNYFEVELTGARSVRT